MNAPQKILIVEDDVALAHAISINLKARSYEVRTANTASLALRIAGEWSPDLILLDLGLPDMSGLSMLQGTRGWTDTPIIVVSERHEQQGKIEALDLNADDYVTRPFNMGELMARVRVALRRRTAGAAESNPVVETTDGRPRFDLSNRQVWVEGQEVNLTPNEWGIVDYLIRNHGSLVSKLDLLHAVWEKTTTGKPTTCGCTCSNCGRNWRPTPKPTALHHLAKRWLPIRAVEAFRRDRAR